MFAIPGRRWSDRNSRKNSGKPVLGCKESQRRCGIQHESGPGGRELTVARRRIVGGLDVGTTKICACIGEETADGGVAVIGVGVSPSRGLRRGVVVDLEATARAIQEAAAAAAGMAGTPLESVYVNVSGPHIASLNSSGVIAISGAQGEITAADAERVLLAARAVK